MERKPGKRTDITSSHNGTKSTPYQDTLQQNNLSKQEASRWQQLAKIPEKEFEKRLQVDRTISTRGLIDPPKLLPVNIDKTTMLTWGMLLDFEKLELSTRTPASLYAEMSAVMKDDIHRLCPAFLEWMTQLGKAAHDDHNHQSH